MTPSRPRPTSAEPDNPGREKTWRNNRYMDGKYDRGWDMSVEMIAAILLWGGVGWLVDRWLGTEPWAMVVGFLVGNAAGVYLVYVRARADEQHQAGRDLTDGRAAPGDSDRTAPHHSATHPPDGRQ